MKQFCKNPFSVPAQQPDAVGGDGSRLTGNRLAGAEVPEAPTLVNAGPEERTVSLPGGGFRDLCTGESLSGETAPVPPYSVRLLGRG